MRFIWFRYKYGHKSRAVQRLLQELYSSVPFGYGVDLPLIIPFPVRDWGAVVRLD